MQREFMRLDYEAESWGVERKVVVECEGNAHCTNRRAVVTKRIGAVRNLRKM